MQESFNDYPGEICIILFTKSCTFDCTDCHNKYRLLRDPVLSLNSVISYLMESKPLISHVTVSGGEPTLESELVPFLKDLHDRGFGLKLDTNGTNPDILVNALPYLSVVAMDIKEDIQDYSRYLRVCRTLTEDEFSRVQKSARILSAWNASGLGKVIFRTTLFDDEIDSDRVKESLSDFSYSDYVVQKKVKL